MLNPILKKLSLSMARRKKNRKLKQSVYIVAAQISSLWEDWSGFPPVGNLTGQY
jgi:hypothetical protein